MIVNFEEITEELTKYEEETLLPLFVASFKTKLGPSNKVTSKEIISRLSKIGYKVTGARIRKIVHYIRAKRIVKALIATSNGYYVATSREDLEKAIKSLRQRARSINKAADCLQKDLNDLF